LQYWLEKLTAMFTHKNKANLSGHYSIQSCYGRGDKKGIIVAWKVKFYSKLGLKDKQFTFTKYGDKDSALAKAIEYRDTKIQGLINKLFT
jgi:hypothetical protein